MKDDPTIAISFKLRLSQANEMWAYLNEIDSTATALFRELIGQKLHKVRMAKLEAERT